MAIMDGRKLAKEIRNNVRTNVSQLNNIGVDVGLGLMLIGDNLSSRQYLATTLEACKKTGITPYEFRFPDNISINEVLNAVNAINNDNRIHGLLVFLPIPKRINVRRIINSIIPQKDIDGLGSNSIGKLAAEESTFQLDPKGCETCKHAVGFLPCTPFGVIRLLEFYNVDIKGKHAVIIGKSLAVGKPLSLMFLTKEATVTVCHKETKNLPEITKQADILCVAAGKPNLITQDMVKEGVVVVDIGINVLNDRKIVGDVDFINVSKKASLITPVPGGVGPVTISMLLENTVKSARAWV